jgi:ureidoacrylate peracid hydrolase
MPPTLLDTLDAKVCKENAALIVIDVQNDFCHPEGAGGLNGGDVSPQLEMVPRLLKFIDAARAAEVPVIFVRAIHNKWTTSPARTDRRVTNKQHAPTCWEGSWGAEFYLVEPLPGECIVTKHRFSAFINTDLDLILRAQGIKTIIMTGVATTGCVESTARDGFMLDYYMVFVGDCAAQSVAPGRHEMTLRNMAANFGEVCNAKDVEAIWDRQAGVAQPIPALAMP